MFQTTPPASCLGYTDAFSHNMHKYSKNLLKLDIHLTEAVAAKDLVLQTVFIFTFKYVHKCTQKPSVRRIKNTENNHPNYKPAHRAVFCVQHAQSPSVSNNSCRMSWILQPRDGNNNATNVFARWWRVDRRTVSSLVLSRGTVSFTQRGSMDLGRALCVITGASRGLGRTIATEMSRLVKPGSVLVLVARSADDLRALQAELAGSEAGRAGVVAECVVADLAQAEGLQRVVQVSEGASSEEMDHIILVNNAGK